MARYAFALSFLLAGTALFSAPLSAANADPQAVLEAKFDAVIDAKEIGGWIKTMAAAPNHVGSPHDKANAEMTLKLFREFGFEAEIETFKMFYPTPITQAVELLGAKPFKATLTEPPIKGDPVTQMTGEMLPAYVAFQGDGDVTAPLVYVNYGMPEDYKTLERLGVSVKGKIVITRYGAGWRGLKPKLAYDHGAIGCLIYSDPRDDGYSHDAVYPAGAARPPGGVQRGSVGDMAIYPGDVLTPGVAATETAKRYSREELPTILKIPTVPISYGDAQHLLESLDGRVVPAAWRGGLPITYRVGGNGAPLHLLVKSDWGFKTLYNVVATIKGSSLPDQWVLRGNHRDGWVAGATDPLSGHSAMLSEAKALGRLLAEGWRPKRTIKYLSWDGEEAMLVGSTEHVEAHEADLRQHGIIYINSDSNARGFFSAGGSFAYQHLVNQVAAGLTDPETSASVSARRRAGLRLIAAERAATPEQTAEAKVAADPTLDLPIEALGSGSDYSAFLQHAGIAALNIGYGGEGDGGGVYHSAYDTYEHHSRFVDPGFTYDALLAKTVGRLVLRLADADKPVQRYQAAAERIATLVDEVKRLADRQREKANSQAQMIAADIYRLADDPTLSRGAPTALRAVPQFSFAALEEAAARLSASAKAADSAIDTRWSDTSDAAHRQAEAQIQAAELLLSPTDVGLPGRPWYRNLITAPGKFTGYGAKTLPGVREAIEDERFEDVDRMIAATSAAIKAYAGALDKVAEALGAEAAKAQ